MSLYLSLNEFKQAPTGIDVTNLDQTQYGNQAAQDATLLNVLRRASSWVDSIVQQPTLEASVNTEVKEVSMSRDGRASVHVDQTPIVSLQTVEYRLTPKDPWENVALNEIQVYDNWFTIYNVLDFGSAYMGYNSPYARATDMPVTVRYTYVNGWVNTRLSVNAALGANTITVEDTTGILVNQKLTIYDGEFQEVVYVNAINGNVLTLKSPLLFAHTKGVFSSAIPDNIKQAALLLSVYLIKERGSLAVTMQESTISTISYNANKADDLTIAKQLLAPYKRVVTS